MQLSTLKKMIRLIATTFVIVLSCHSLFAGITGIVEGKIIDKNSKEPMPFVNVTILGTRFGAASDTEGRYRINNVRAGVYDIRFSMVGFKTVVMKNVTILPDLRTKIDVEMEQGILEFETIEVRAERPLI